MNDEKGLAPVIVGPLGGDTVFLVGDTYTTLLSGAETGGTFTLLEALVPPDTGPPPHHHNADAGVLRWRQTPAGDIWESSRTSPAAHVVSDQTGVLLGMPSLPN